MQTPILQPHEENIPGHSTEKRTLTDMLIFRHYDNSVWYKENNFSQQIQFFLKSLVKCFEQITSVHY